MLGATLGGFKVRAYRSARDCKSLFKKSVKEIRHVPGGECALSLVLSTLTRRRRRLLCGVVPTLQCINRDDV